MESLYYQSKTQKYVAALAQQQKLEVGKDAFDRYRRLVSKYGHRFDYVLPPRAHAALEDLGFFINADCIRLHSHPVSKVIENHFLSFEIPSAIQGMNPICCCIKPEKVKWLELPSERILNPVVCVRDLQRYGASGFGVTDCSNFMLEIARRAVLRYGLDQDYLFHDSLHYCGMDDFVEFLRVARPNCIVAQIVYPFEILDGSDFSYYPNFYTFEKKDDNLIFAPDGCYEQSYVQPLDFRWFIETRSVKVDGMVYTISLTRRVGAHALFTIRRGSYLEPKEILVKDTDVLDRRSFEDMGERMPLHKIRYSVVAGAASYLLSIKKPDAESAVAKYRALVQIDINPEEMLFISSVGSLVENFGVANLVEMSVMEAWLDALSLKSPRFMRIWFAKRYVSNRLLHGIRNMCARSYFIKRVDRHFGMRRCELIEGAVRTGVVSIFEEGVDALLADRVSMPYSYVLSEVNGLSEPVLGAFAFDGSGFRLEEQGIVSGLLNSGDSKAACALRTLFGWESPEPIFSNARSLGWYTAENVPVVYTTGRYVPRHRRVTENWDCFIQAFSKCIGKTCADVTKLIETKGSLSMRKCLASKLGFTPEDIRRFLLSLNLTCRVKFGDRYEKWGVEASPYRTKLLEVSDGHIDCRDVIGYEPKVAPDLADGFFQRVNADLVEFTVDVLKAKQFADSSFMGATGVQLDMFKVSGDIHSCLAPDNFKIDLGVIYGFAGSGKSRKLCDCLFKAKQTYVYVVPRKALRDDLYKKGARKSSVPTFETFLKSYNLTNVSVLVLDEIGLYPPGYLEFVCCKASVENPKINILLTGDPMQSYYHSKDDNLLLPEFEYPFRSGLQYPLFTYRCGGWIEELFGVPSYSKNVDSWDLRVVKDAEGMQILCADRDTKLAHRGSFTFGESQGLTFERCAIVVNRPLFLTGLETLIVALTRSVCVPVLLDQFELLGELLAEFSRTKPVHCAIFQGGKVNLFEHFGWLKDCIVRSGPVLRGAYDVMAKKDADTLLYALLDERPGEEFVDVVAEEDTAVKESLKTHLMRATSATCHAGLAQVKDSLHREFVVGNGPLVTEQFLDSQVKCYGEFVGYNAYQNIYPRHRSRDFATLLMAVRKRLRFSNPTKELERFERKKQAGFDLANLFLQYIGDFQGITNVDMNKAQLEFNEKRLEKASGVLHSHKGRSEPDWPNNKMDIFLKNQRCTKWGNRYCDAKAGQTIACFNHKVLTHFGVWARAFEIALKRALPKNWLFYSGFGPEELDAHVKRHHLGGRCVESDYTAFDSSQDVVVLALELRVLEAFGVPDYILHDYKMLKLNMYSNLGESAVMRFTGEFGTFVFNTLCNIIFTLCRYHVDCATPMMFAGDDMVILADVAERFDEQSAMLDNLSLVAKVCKVRKPMFCGWMLTPHGIYKHPQLVLERLMIAVEGGNFEKVADSYFLEALKAYDLSDYLYLYMDWDELQAQSKVMDYFVTHSNKIHKSLFARLRP